MYLKGGKKVTNLAERGLEEKEEGYRWKGTGEEQK